MRLLSLAALFFLVPAAVNADAVMTSSWYGKQFEGKKMANGKPFHMHDASIVAHKTLRMGCILELQNPKNQRILIATVKDRGPYIKGRELDLSYAGAEALGFVHEGVIRLHVNIVYCP